MAKFQNRFVLQLSVCLLALFFVSESFAQETKELLTKIPGDANALVIIDAEALAKTPRAKAESWAARRNIENPARAVTIPPEAKKVMVASRLNTGDDLTPMWELGMVSSKSSFSINAIAKAEAGYVDWIGASQVVWTPIGAYFAAVDRDLLGIVYPADRQFAARWMEFAREAKTPTISSYLQRAAAQVKPTSQIVLALDLKNSVQPHRIQAKLLEFEPVKKNTSLAKSWGELISSLQGVTLVISVAKDIKADFQINFANDPSILAPYHKELVLGALENFGATIPDVEKWDFEIKNNAIVASGALSTSGLRRIGSLIELPSTKYDDYESGDTASGTGTNEPVVDSAEQMKQNSQVYFKSVTTLIDDLRETLSDTRDNHALWFERYARKIDRLPILNVDEELLAYGAMVGETFRQIALAKRGAGIKSGVRKSAIYSNYYYPTTGGSVTYGYDSVGRKSSSMRNEINRQEQAKASKVRFESWNEIENATAAMRKTMTQKYGVEF